MPATDEGASAHRRVRDRITLESCKTMLIELVKVPSPQTVLMEDEPLLKRFISGEVKPRLRKMGFSDIQYEATGNLYLAHGAGTSGRSLMLITNAMNQPQATMTRAYEGDVASSEPYGLPGEVVLGKGASEQKSNMAAMFVAMESVVASGISLTGRLVHLCCLSGETGKHDGIKSLVDATGATAEMAFLGGTSLKLSLGNRGRLDVSIKVRGRSVHSSGPKNGCNAITGRWTYCAAWGPSISAGAMRASATRRLRSTAFVAFPRAPTRSKIFARSPLTDAYCRERTLMRRLPRLKRSRWRSTASRTQSAAKLFISKSSKDRLCILRWWSPAQPSSNFSIRRVTRF